MTPLQFHVEIGMSDGTSVLVGGVRYRLHRSGWVLRDGSGADVAVVADALSLDPAAHNGLVAHELFDLRRVDP